jgi:hypothetical protein
LLSIDPPVGVGFLGSFRQHIGFFPHLQFAGRRFSAAREVRRWTSTGATR